MLRSPHAGEPMPPDAFEVLRSVPLFRQVPEDDLRALAQLVRERTHPRGSLILTQGDPGEALFLIQSGQVKRSEEHTSELQSPDHLVCRLLLEKKNHNS